MDRKDAIIQMLDRDLEEAEDQFQMSLRAHLENMDRLIDLQVSVLGGVGACNRPPRCRRP